MDTHVRIFDTTLRDGEQSPGAALTPEEKLEVARALAALGVDVIEAGFPAASGGDLEGVRTIAREVGRRAAEARREPPVICGLARATRDDLEKCWEAIKDAARPRIHTFLATSDLHMQHKLRLQRDEVLGRIREAVHLARQKCDDVEFSPEDGSRTDPDFLLRAVGVAVEAGATTINIPDTVGYALPEEYGALIARVVKAVPKEVVVSVHCHDDLGLAVANTLAGLRAGARQAEVSINGIGERAGNCSLEEVVMALHVREPVLGMRTSIDTTKIVRTSRLVSTLTGMAVQANKAIVGANAFSHESGIHQDGMLKHHRTYEILEPALVGAERSRLVLGKHSGRHAFQVHLAELGFPLEGEALDQCFARFKELADKKKTLSDADLCAIATSRIGDVRERLRLDGLQVSCGTMGMPTASVRLTDENGTLKVQASVGTGPVDAVFKAISEVAGIRPALLEYRVHAVTEGIDALGEVSVKVRDDSQAVSANPQYEVAPRVFHGHGADTDIVVASAKAYLAVVNRILAARETLESEKLEQHG
jgi:2-isopropylmalate synthase